MALPGPTRDQVRNADPVLTTLMNLRDNADTDFVADRAFPVAYSSGQVTGQVARIQTGMRGAGAIEIDRGAHSPYAQVGFNAGWVTYTCREYGAEVAIDAEMRGQSQIPMDLQQLAAIRALREVQIQRDLRCVTAFFGTGDWTNEATLGAAAQWDDAGGDPLVDLWTAKRAVQLNASKTPNALLLGWDGFRVAVQSGDITGLMPSAVRQSQMTLSELEARLAEAFEFRSLYVGRAVRNTANLISTNVETLAFVWVDNALIFYRSEGGLESSAGMQFASTEGGSATVTDRYFKDETREEVVRVRETRDELVIDLLAGYLIIDLAN